MYTYCVASASDSFISSSLLLDSFCYCSVFCTKRIFLRKLFSQVSKTSDISFVFLKFIINHRDKLSSPMTI